MHRFATSTLFIVTITAFRQNKFFFNENTSVLFIKQEVHNIDYKYTVNLFLLKALLGFFSMKKIYLFKIVASLYNSTQLLYRTINE